MHSDITVIPNTPSSQTSYSVSVPGSKSISNRILFLAAMAHGTCRITGLLQSEDTEVMQTAMSSLGATLQWDGKDILVTGTGGQIRGVEELYLANAGTATRFLTTAMCLVKEATHCTTILGSKRAEARPQDALIAALNKNGMRVESVNANGCVPLRVFGGGFKGGKMILEGKVSSQYVSSVLLSAPFAESPLDLTLLESDPTSILYIEMTLQNMRQFGVEVQRPAINRFIVPNTIGYKAPAVYAIEGDASSATYALASAALRPGVSVTVLNVGSKSLQGDAKFCMLLQKMGCVVQQTATTTTVTGPKKLKALGKVNMADLTDAFLTLAVVAAFADGETEITGIANQHQKECDRIAAMVCEFSKVGIHAINLADGIKIFGREFNKANSTKVVPIIETYDDHRIAMAFSLFGLKSSVVICDKDCTAKTYPEYWDVAAKHLGFTLEEHTEPTIDYADKSIIVIGMRGAGKSTCAKAAVDALSFYKDPSIAWKLVDIDLELEKLLNLSCADIVTQYGWDGFRTKEAELLKYVLQENPSHTVIACGGGIVETNTVRAILKSYTGPVVYIDRQIYDIEQDLQKVTVSSARPNYENESLRTVHQRREPWFKECSNYDFVIPRNENNWHKISICFGELCRSFQMMPTPDISRPGYVIVSDFSQNGDGVIIPLKEAYDKVSLAQRPVIIHVNYVTDIAIAARLAPAYICLETYFDPDVEDLRSALKILGNSTKIILVGSERAALVDEIGVELWNRVATVWDNVNLYDKRLNNIEPNKLYLFGSAIYKSPSPTIHNTASKELKLGFEYQICDTRDVQKLLWIMNSPSFKGASVTIPHKQVTFDKAVISSTAQTIGAVNTLVKTATGEMHAHNTDWIGIKHCLERSLKNVQFSQQAALIIGAGGTAMAAVYCLVKMGFKSIHIYNRTKSKADEIANKFCKDKILSVTSLDKLQNIAVIVSTIPATAGIEIPVHLFASKPVVLDAAYKITTNKLTSEADTALVAQAKKHGCVVYRGFDMLLEQALEQLKIWRGSDKDIPSNTVSTIKKLCL